MAEPGQGEAPTIPDSGREEPQREGARTPPAGEAARIAQELPVFNLQGPEVSDPHIQAIIEAARQAININPEIGGNRTWLEALHGEMRNARASLIEERDDIAKKISKLHQLRDFGKMDSREFNNQLPGLEEECTRIEERITEAKEYENRIIEQAWRAGLAQAPDRSVQERTDRIVKEINSIREQLGEHEARKRFKEIVGTLNVEEQIDPHLLSTIAGDEEVADRFFDTIISKPFAQPDVPYHQNLGFYAGINRLAFLDAVRVIDAKRHQEYSRRAESSERLHEMNRTILAESGNPEAYVSHARTITHHHLQTATQIDGVEVVRQLFELAYGRLYAQTERVTGDNFEPEIEDWVEKQFKMLAKNGKVKSRFKGLNGQPRDLELWEVNRAIAFGRNITTAFYRQSELMSWSNIPKEWERWIESLPTEFVVRAMAGLKWLSYRFRIGISGGGPQLMTLLLKEIKSKYTNQEGPRLDKIGKLNVADDLYPAGYFRGAGFDKGWRIFQAYLRTDVMRIMLPQPSEMPAENREKMTPDEKREREALFKKYGNCPTLGDFIFDQEYMAQLKASEEATIEGVKVPEELRRFDSEEMENNFAIDFIPLLGYRRVTDPKEIKRLGKLDEKGLDAEGIKKVKSKKRVEVYFMEDPSQQQIHLNFGTLISFGAVNKTVKEILWKRAAEVLPLRLAYLLSEEGALKDDKGQDVTGGNRGVRGILEERFRDLRGQGDNLFSDEFETKLIMLQRARISAQIQEQKDALRERKQAKKIPLNLDDPTIDLSDPEKEFVGLLQKLGRQNAAALAKISFPHVPFHDDTTYQDADYTKLRGETFARRQGGDFQAFVQTNNEFNTILDNLGVKYEDILEHLRNIVRHLSTPENKKTGQDITLPILESYLKLSRQWTGTRIPFVKTIWNFLNRPTSHLQKFYGMNAPSDDESELNVKVRLANEKEVIRREIWPGEDKSQVNKLLEELGGRWYNVLWRELRNALVIYFILMALKFGEKTAKEKT